MLKIENTLIGYDNNPIMEIDMLSIVPGEVTALIGKSGCGKSTLFSTIAGHIPMIKGNISLDGHTAQSYKKENIALTLQGFPLYHWLTVEENLALAAKIKDANNTQFTEILKQFSAEHLANVYPSQLSGGEKCRASLSQAILTEPTLLMLDEPFVGLDTITKNAIGENLFSFVKNHKIAALMITHDIHDAIEHAQKIIVFGQKRGSDITTIKHIFDSNQENVYQDIIDKLQEEYI